MAVSIHEIHRFYTVNPKLFISYCVSQLVCFVGHCNTADHNLSIHFYVLWSLCIWISFHDKGQDQRNIAIVSSLPANVISFLLHYNQSINVQKKLHSPSFSCKSCTKIPPKLMKEFDKYFSI